MRLKNKMRRVFQISVWFPSFLLNSLIMSSFVSILLVRLGVFSAPMEVGTLVRHIWWFHWLLWQMHTLLEIRENRFQYVWIIFLLCFFFWLSRQDCENTFIYIPPLPCFQLLSPITLFKSVLCCLDLIYCVGLFRRSAPKVEQYYTSNRLLDDFICKQHV